MAYFYGCALKAGLDHSQVKFWHIGLCYAGWMAVLCAPLYLLARSSSGVDHDSARFEGILWTWTSDKEGEISNLEACCADCDSSVLEATSDYSKRQTRFHCNACQKALVVNKSYAQVDEQVTRLIGQRGQRVVRPQGVTRLQPVPAM